MPNEGKPMKIRRKDFLAAIDLGHLGVDRAAMNQAAFRALEPGGLYVIADHSGRPGTGISESGTLHRIEEAFLRHARPAATDG
jgi:predicted methyltransferase